ncbi:MAG: peptidoglycan DD-metalloendopeptidase family protein [Lachnospiraceae bacterium]
MKKFGWKTRLQWGIYVAALFGIFLAAIFVPSPGNTAYFGNGKINNPITALLEDAFSKQRIIVAINNQPVAVAGSLEAGEAAYKAARLRCNKNGLVLVDATVSYIVADRKRDGQFLREHNILKEADLEQLLYKQLNQLINQDGQLAYTIRIDDFTVTVDNMEDVVGVLEKAQGAYDKTDAFQVTLARNENHNISNYEVAVHKKKDAVLETSGVIDSSNQELVDQSREDGVKNIRFAEPIYVVATMAKANQVTNEEDAYAKLTEEKGEEAVYVVEPGDYMELIAEKNNMELSLLRELNPQIESDEDLYYDDRLKVMVPSAALTVMVDRQETYEENYYADVEYEDDDSMYIGESTVVQEGQEGKHIVTDLVTYEGEIEAGREQVKETVEVAAVAQIIRRGTKSRPTYMYPVTNWNVTSTFGQRWGRLHAGIDVGIPTGTTVRASRSGRVVTAGWVGGYGNCVMIDHGDGVQTRYGHLSQVLVSVGQYVDQGQQIALSGNTGRSTGPHLHFEMRVNGEATNPAPYLEGRS